MRIAAEGEPELTHDAARVLLRILRKEHEKSAATDRTPSTPDDQAIAS